MARFIFIFLVLQLKRNPNRQTGARNERVNKEWRRSARDDAPLDRLCSGRHPRPPRTMPARVPHRRACLFGGTGILPHAECAGGMDCPSCAMVAGCSRRFEQSCGRFVLPKAVAALPLRVVQTAVSDQRVCRVCPLRPPVHVCGRWRLCSGCLDAPAVRTSQDSLFLAGHCEMAPRDESAAG